MTKAIFRTISGTYIDLLRPDAALIRIEDIAHGLSGQCRFNGQIPEFYSVAQHSVLCFWIARQSGCTVEEQFGCLLHDAAEAYIGDMVRPLKQHLPSFTSVEQGVDAAIVDALKFDYREHAGVVKRIDLTALATEKRYLIPDDKTEWDCLKGYQSEYVPWWSSWAPEEAKDAFLAHFKNCLICVEKAAAAAI